MSEIDPREVFFDRRSDKAIFSKRFPDVVSGQKLRIVSRVLDSKEGLQFAKMGEEIVLRTTSAGRFQIKDARQSRFASSTTTPFAIVRLSRSVKAELRAMGSPISAAHFYRDLPFGNLLRNRTFIASSISVWFKSVLL
jgi:hypothetical protein